MSAEAFATEVVGKGLGASHVVVGHDFTYGKGRAGSTAELGALGRVLGFGVDVVEPVGAGEGIFSSSRIREELRAGEVREAAEQLGFGGACAAASRRARAAARASAFPPSMFRSRRARTFATASMPCACITTGGGTTRAGYVGARPTFGEGAPVLEAYLFDFAGDLYGAEVEVEFIAFLRPDQTFASADAACSADGEGLRCGADGAAADRRGRSDAPLPSGPRAFRAAAAGLS